METFVKKVDKIINVSLQAPLGQLDQYRVDALRSENPLQEVRTDAGLLRACLAAAIAMADVIDLLKKTVVYGRDLDYDQFNEVLQEVVDTATEARFLTRTPAMPELVPMNPRFFHAAVGLYGESGEILQALLHESNGEQLNIHNMIEEGGDACWYLLALYVDELIRMGACTAAQMLLMNVAKLAKRFPEKFSLVASEGRDYAAERVAMEQARAAA